MIVQETIHWNDGHTLVLTFVLDRPNLSDYDKAKLKGLRNHLTQPESKGVIQRELHVITRIEKDVVLAKIEEALK